MVLGSGDSPKSHMSLNNTYRGRTSRIISVLHLHYAGAVIIKFMSKYKIVVTVPENETEVLREAIGNAGGGKVGNYTHCSFSVKGTGRFLPIDGAKPTVGQVGQLEKVAEERIEITCDGENVKAVVAAIRKEHSYEEPAIDVYKLEEL